MAKELEKNRSLIQILAVYSLFRGKKYGETANECGEAFFFYGKSLLELARYVFQAKFKVRCLYHNDLFKNF